MQGIVLQDLYEQISHLHEIEFIFNSMTYMLQPEINEEKNWLTIWMCSDKPHCICRHEIPEHGDIPKEIIDSVLSEKCFNGKSFLEVEKDIEVTVIY